MKRLLNRGSAALGRIVGGGSRSDLRAVTAASVATGLAGQAALLITGPLLARMLGLGDRGYLASLLLWPVIISRVGGLGLPSAITYYIARGSATAKTVARDLLPFTLLQALLLTALHGALLLVLLRNEPASVRAAGMATLALVPASLAYQYGLAILQGHRRFALFNAMRVLPVFVYAALIVYLFLAGAGSIVAVAVWWTAISAAAGAATLVAGLRIAADIDPETPAVDRKTMIRFGLGGLVGTISPLESFRLDQAVLALFLPPAALGLYVVGLAFTNLPRFLAQSVGLVAYPNVAARTDARAGRRLMWTFLWSAVGGSIAIVTPLLLFSGWLVPALFGDEFDGAATITRILLPGMVFFAARRVLADGLRGSGYPQAGTLAEVTAWLWLAPTLAILVPLWGANGVAAAFSSAYAVSLGALVFVAAIQQRPEADAPAPRRIAWLRLLSGRPS